jgi:hypothetical protein
MVNLSQSKRLPKQLAACPGGCSDGTLPLNPTHNKWLSWLVVVKISLRVYLKGIWEVACNIMRKDCWEIAKGYSGTWLSHAAKTGLRHK